MHQRWHWLALLLISLTGCAAAALPHHSNVLVLSPQALPQAMHDYGSLFLLVDDSLESRLFDRFADAATAIQLEGNNSKTPQFAAMEVSVTDDAMLPTPTNMSITELPALFKLTCPDAVLCSLNEITAEPYDGGRSSMELERFARGAPRKEVVQVTTRAELDALARTTPFLVLFAVQSWDSQLYYLCDRLAQIDVKDSVYAATTNMHILAQDQDASAIQLETLSVPGIVAIRDFGRNLVQYEGAWKRPAIVRFLRHERYSLITTYSDIRSDFFHDRTVQGHVLLFSQEIASYHPALIAQAEQVAEKYFALDSNPEGIRLRFLWVPSHETAVRDALIVLNHNVPTAVLVQDPSSIQRLRLVGADAIAAIENGTYANALADWLARVFPPSTLDSIGTSRDWPDNSDLFQNTKTKATTKTTCNARAQTKTQVDHHVRIASHISQPHLDDLTTTNVATDAELLAMAAHGPVLIVFSIPQCGGCRKAKHVLGDLRDALRQLNTAVVFVKVNYVGPQLLDLRVVELPAIYLLPSPTHAAVAFSSEALDAEELLAFVSEELTAASD